MHLAEADMTIHTVLTEMLGIRHPVLLAPMDLVADGRLAAAVSAAGGFGVLGGGYGNEAWLTTELDAAGKARIGVGFITWSMARQPRLLDITLERKPAAVMLSFGDPAPHADQIKRAGALLICQVQTVAMARDAVAKGADIIVAQGAEGGGHGVAVSTMPLVPAVVDAVGDRVPVAAAGGIADGRGLAAALMLGAGGVLLGTRFYASAEAAGHPDAKRRIVAADETQSIRGILFDIARRNVWPAPFSGRCLVNAHVERWKGREGELMQRAEEVGADYLRAREAGNFEIAAVIAGESAGLIHDIRPAAEIIETIVAGAETALSRGAGPMMKAAE
jgi:nitronate monooxygenase